MTAYYNEIDPYAAQWLRNLITAGHIAPGIVDERSIEDVTPYDLKEFTQCHFFAGIGVWSHALRRAGWADDRPVWTGSCPCQPFSSAGKGAGFDDERHLWPAFNHLIRECRPAIVIGEQVASKDSEPWLDLVQADVEALGYAFGAIPFPSASIGAPHIRDRLYWVANNEREGLEGRGRAQRGEQRSHGQVDALRASSGLGYAGQNHDASEVYTACAGQQEADRPADQLGGPSVSSGRLGRADNGTAPTLTGIYERAHPIAGRSGAATGPTTGFWGAADWLLCRDGKWRPVEPGTFSLAHGAASRVGRLRAYGNAINAEAARIFIESVM